MVFITFAPENGIRGTTGFLHGRLARYFVSPRVDTFFASKKFHCFKDFFTTLCPCPQRRSILRLQP
jgi:hypothetical protein